MNINLTGNGLEITPALREYVDMKIGGLDKFLVKFEANSVKTRVVVSRTTAHHKHGDVYKTSVDLVLPGKTLHADAEGSDARMTIDDVRHKLEREIKKYKDLNAVR